MQRVALHPGEDGQRVAERPSLPGCLSQGHTREEAIASVGEAVAGSVEALEADGLPVPEEGHPR